MGNFIWNYLFCICNMFEKELKNFLHAFPEEDLKKFFKEKFSDPLIVVLKSDSETPAEKIRHQLQQIEKIQQILLTLRGS